MQGDELSPEHQQLIEDVATEQELRKEEAKDIRELNMKLAQLAIKDWHEKYMDNLSPKNRERMIRSPSYKSMMESYRETKKIFEDGKRQQT